MTADKRCIYLGEIFVVIDEALVHGRDKTGNMVDVLLLGLTKEEATLVGHISEAIIVFREDVTMLISGLDFVDSEWYLGGQRGRS